jgi:hypothetical protein
MINGKALSGVLKNRLFPAEAVQKYSFGNRASDAPRFRLGTYHPKRGFFCVVNFGSQQLLKVTLLDINSVEGQCI